LYAFDGELKRDSSVAQWRASRKLAGVLYRQMNWGGILFTLTRVAAWPEHAGMAMQTG
jgi:hypothetical protein